MAKFETSNQHVAGHKRRDPRIRRDVTVSGGRKGPGYDRSVTVKKLSNAEKVEIMRQRTPKAIAQDVGKVAPVPEDEGAWENHPNRYDLPGVDLPRDLKKPKQTRSKPSPKKENTEYKDMDAYMYEKLPRELEPENMSKTKLKNELNWLEMRRRSMKDQIRRGYVRDRDQIIGYQSDIEKMGERRKKIMAKQEKRKQPKKEEKRDPWAKRDYSKMTSDQKKIDDAIRDEYPGVEYSWRENHRGNIDVMIKGRGGGLTSLNKAYIEAHPPPKEKRIVQATMNDIDPETASRAHSGTSMSPERRGISERRDHVVRVNEFVGYMQANVQKGEHGALKEDLEEYRKWEARKTTENLHGKSGIYSTMIAGPSNFPVRQMEKKNNAQRNREEKYYAAREKYQKRIKKKYGIGRSTAISSDDDDAVEQLQAKIKKAKEDQERYKAINKITRSKKLTKEQKIERIQKDFDFKKSTAEKIMEPDYAGRSGVPQYNLTNNRANIKRMEGRVIEIERKRSQTSSETPMKNGTIVDNVEANRVQLMFNGKPDYETRTALKKRGFRWSPSNEAWQAYRSTNTKWNLEDLKEKGVI